MKRSRGRPKGWRDLRPRVKRKSDTWPEDEQQGEAKDSSLRTQGPIPMLSSTAALSSAANTMSSALDLQRLLSYSGAPLHHDKAGGARSQQISSSNTNTSHSQTSSYPTDDSHSGDRGSASGHSGDHSGGDHSGGDQGSASDADGSNSGSGSQDSASGNGSDSGSGNSPPQELFPPRGNSARGAR